MATFAFDAGDEVGRRLAAVQLVTTDIASAVTVAEGFGVSVESLWRWRRSFDVDGVGGLMTAKTGPKGPRKLTGRIIKRARELDEQGRSLAAIGEALGISVSTVRVALGRVNSAPGRQATDATADDDPEPEDGCDVDRVDDEGGTDQPGATLAVGAIPPPPLVQPAVARAREPVEAPGGVTAGAHLPLAGVVV